MLRISSPQHPRVKEAVGLRDRRRRQRERRTLIDGVRELSRAVAAGVPLVEVFVCPPLCRGPESAPLLDRLSRTGVEIIEVAEAVFGKLAFGQRSEGVLGVAVIPQRTLSELVLPPDPLVAVLEGVEKPGNLGAVLRSADGAGLSAVVVADARTDLYNPNAIRASLGTIFTLPVGDATAAETLAWIKRQGITIFAARLDASLAYTEADFRRPAAIVLGSEAAGLTSLWSDPQVTALRVPMLGAADSLNVSAAAAVLFYEARRQRGTHQACGHG
jgi:TrmH family RNA methyltransferase